MNIFDSRYFSANKILLSCIGFRPYGSMSNNVVRTTCIALAFLMMMPHAISAIIHHKNIDRLMLNLVCFLTLAVVFLKLVAFGLSEKDFEELYDSMTNNFQTIRDEEERQILYDYSERGRLLTMIYSTGMLLSGITISLLPLTPTFLDIIHPLKEPRAKIHLMEGEFFFDRDVHPFAMFCCETTTTAMVTLVTFAIDSMYMASAEHACSLYAIISFRLRTLKRNVSEDNSPTSEDNSYDQLLTTIIFHQKTLRFTLVMNNSYSMTFLFVMIVDLARIPLVGCAIIANLDTWAGFMPYILLFNAITIHLLMIFYPGQRILDHGTDLLSASFCNEWYALPHRSKKLLMIFMLRSTLPASLEGGGLFLIELKTFAMIMKTSVSYIAVLASFRD